MDRRDERRRKVRELRDGGASLRAIAEALGISPATAMRDCRVKGGAGSASVPPERGETASDGAGAGTSTGGVDLSDYASVTAEMQRLYAALAAGEKIPASQVRLLERRHAELLRQEDVCKDHMTLQVYLDELHWRDRQWVDQLQVACRRLTATGAANAESILNELLENIRAITKAGRNRN